jgi:ATP-dependent DNA helicase RecG
MEKTEFLNIISGGEDSKTQFKRDFTNPDSLATEMSATALTPADIDLNYFNVFFERKYKKNLQEQELPLPSILSNMNLMNGSFLNTAGALLFAISPQFKLPLFIVKAISYPGTEINESAYIDSRDITGKIRDLFDNTIAFISANIPHIQNGKSVNSVGDLSIPRIVLEEMTANALIHRDYFISAPIRVFVFIDRIEIISPGHLPNNLTVENIKAGNSNIRNPILASFATKLIPYRGLGTGIIRALKIYPNIDLIDDRENNLFKVIIYRP